MRFFVGFSAAMVWALTVCGAGSWVIWQINPDRWDASMGEAAACVGILAVEAVLAIGGFCLAHRWIDGR